MVGYIWRRLGQALISLLLVSVVIFGLTEVVGDPIALLVNPEAGKEEYERIRALYGYDRPVLERYWSFLAGTVTGNWGDSVTYGRPAMSVVLDRLPVTAMLAVGAMIISLVVAIPLGALAGSSPQSATDRLSVIVATLGQVVPGFLVAIVLVMIFGIQLQWLPAGGMSSWKHAILPIIALGAWSLAAMTRLTRSGVREAMGQPFVILARSKGMSKRAVVQKHALRAASLSILTYGGLQLGMLLNGALIMETVFNIPGIGSLALNAVSARDVNLVQAVVMLSAVIYLVVSLLVDLAYLIIDPRIRYVHTN